MHSRNVAFVSGSAQTTHGRLTKRDEETLVWLGRHAYATAPQIARHMGTAVTKARARLRLMRGVGLIEHRRLLHQEPGIYWATRKGLRHVRLDLAQASLSLTTYRHTLAVVDLALDFEQRSLPLLTERELRRQRSLGQRQYVIETNLGNHLPDLVLLPGLRPAAVELERTQKSDRRLGAILTGYRDAILEGRIEHLLYFVPDETAQRRLEWHCQAALLSQNDYRIAQIRGLR